MKIIPIKTGSIHCNKGLTITLGKDVGKWVDIPSIAWYVEANGHKILVDTGMCDTERADKYHYKGSKQGKDERIDNALRKIGVRPEDIDIVILTHLHWDHCQHLKLFTEAKFFVQEDELEFALEPTPSYYRSYESEKIGLEPSFIDVKLDLLKGDRKICEGVSVILTKGHSPGHQSVVAETKKGKYIIAGDAVMCYENLQPDKENSIEFTLIGRFFDKEETLKSLKKIKEKADFVLPGHEAKVFEKKEYSA